MSHDVVVLGIQPSTDATLMRLVSRIDRLVGIALVNHILLELRGLIVLFERYLLHVHLLLWDLGGTIVSVLAYNALLVRVQSHVVALSLQLLLLSHTVKAWSVCQNIVLMATDNWFSA